MNRTAKRSLLLSLVVVVGMAFRVSWNALKDVAATIGADEVAALLYPFVVDGLMALALVATLALTGQDRVFALRVLAVYTLASLVLNYVHGLAPELLGRGQHMALAQWAPANWALVLLATSLPVGAIFFGSDLVAKVLHHQPQKRAHEGVLADHRAVFMDAQHDVPASSEHPPAEHWDAARTHRTPGPQSEANAQVTGRTSAVRTHPGAHVLKRTRAGDESARRTQFDDAVLERTRQFARRAYAESLDAGHPIGPKALGEAHGFSEAWGRKQIKAVHQERASEPRVVSATEDRVQ